ncbi:MAG: hypothetical protein OSB67_12155 [Alphaproteobacteria bacterium]|jgi:hypothetical protein|nr:hypothetical protein [Alphaproteobacteria bacterium]
MGETYLAPAQLRLADGAVITAGEAFVRASLCFHVGQVVANHMPDIKRDL